MARLLERAAAMLYGLQPARPLIASHMTIASRTACPSTPMVGSALQSLPHLVDAVACRAAQALSVGGWRGFAANPAAKAGVPQFVGGKMRTYTSYKERFRATATGKVRYCKPGHRHKRWVKGPRRNRRLRGENIMHDAYARVMRKMGFT